ncbi:N-acetylmuramoyl-L-alanine amidase [Actinomadura scrupuli]|uniref:N-acetylmuramoyl-L-alanine amidase n=1 Tax=Actinomadura scrupuli TaxID=559629 RepID=UPI003D957A66
MEQSSGPSRRTALLALAAGAAGVAAGCGSTDDPRPAPSPATGGRRRASSQAFTPRLAGKVVVIDPGHNGGNAAHPEVINKPVDIITKVSTCDTVGAQTASGYAEHTFTWDMANRVKALLEREGAQVILTRSGDHGVGPCIKERALIGNRAHADAAVSIHADGAPRSGHGFHVIEPARVPGHNTGIIAASATLGRALRDAYHQATGVPYSTYAGQDGLNVRDDLGGLNFSHVPKVFIECANMNHPGDAALLATTAFRQHAAEGLTTGLVRFLDAKRS